MARAEECAAAIPSELEQLFMRAFVTLRYDECTDEDCLRKAWDQSSVQERKAIHTLLGRFESDPKLPAAVKASIRDWANRFGLDISDDLIGWLRSVVERSRRKKNKSAQATLTRRGNNTYANYAEANRAFRRSRQLIISGQSGGCPASGVRGWPRSRSDGLS